MKLYYAPNTISVAVDVALHEAGIRHDIVRVDFANNEQSSAKYLGVNSKGRVPALVVDDIIITETGALLDYIATIAPEKNLIPAHPLEAALMRSVMYYLASTMHINHAHKMRGHRWATQQSSFDDMTAKVQETMTASAQHIENECLSGPFILGDNLTIGDCYLYAVCLWLEGDGVVVSDFPKISAFLAAMESRTSVKVSRAAGVIA